MARAVITGPTGAVGMALIDRLIAEGAEVYAVFRPHSARAGHLPRHDRVHPVACGIDELNKLPCLIHDRCDTFYHFMWQATVGADRDHMRLQTTNIQYAIDAAEAAHKLGCSCFIGAGSQAEYGVVSERLTADTPTFPTTGYGMAKLCAGAMTRKVCQGLGLRHIWARILSVYGPGDSDHGAIMWAIRALLRGESPAFTKGEQIWDYLYSADAAEILHLLSQKGKDGCVYCVADGREKPLRAYFQLLEHLLGADGRIQFGAKAYADNQIMRLCADVNPLKEDLGFASKWSFEDGVSKTIQWAKEHPSP